MKSQEKSIPGRRTSLCKGPEGDKSRLNLGWLEGSKKEDSDI